MKAITVNIGSRSKKYSYFEKDNLISSFESEPNDENSFDRFIEKNNILVTETILGIRIVAPGRIFCEHTIITDSYLRSLQESMRIAPLHTEETIREIRHIKSMYPDLKIVAISDSAFHKSIPDYLRYYAVSKEIREKYGVLKQGYHGISLGSIVTKLQNKLGSVPEKLVVAHLGGGSSVTALRDGISIDTSMGFTPLDGIPMAERIGSIDAGALIHIGREQNMSYDELLYFISHSCGLEAVSTIEHGDMKDILAHAEEPNSPTYEESILAIDMYTSRVAKQIAAMSTVLLGIDTLIFTGTIGELSAPIRSKIVSNLSHLNILIDDNKNLSLTKSDGIMYIGSENRERSCAVVFTDESKEMQIALKQFASL